MIQLKWYPLPNVVDLATPPTNDTQISLCINMYISLLLVLSNKLTSGRKLQITPQLWSVPYPNMQKSIALKG